MCDTGSFLQMGAVAVSSIGSLVQASMSTEASVSTDNAGSPRDSAHSGDVLSKGQLKKAKQRRAKERERAIEDILTRAFEIMLEEIWDLTLASPGVIEDSIIDLCVDQSVLVLVDDFIDLSVVENHYREASQRIHARDASFGAMDPEFFRSILLGMCPSLESRLAPLQDSDACCACMCQVSYEDPGLTVVLCCSGFPMVCGGCLASFKKDHEGLVPLHPWVNDSSTVRLVGALRRAAGV